MLSGARSSGHGDSSRAEGNGDDSLEEEVETLLDSIDPSTLQCLCDQYSLPASGTKREMLHRLREFANRQAELDGDRRRGRAKRVEANLEGKARHTIMEREDGFGVQEEDDEDGDEMEGFFYYAAEESAQEKERREEERREKRRKLQLAARKFQSHVVAPTLPEDIKPNEKGERVVTLFSTDDKNDLTGVASQTPMADMSLENAQYMQRSIDAEKRPEESLIGGPFGDTTGSQRKKASTDRVENAKDEIREVVKNLLATTGAPAFQDDFEEGENVVGSYSSPYGFTGFQPERIPPEVFSQSSGALRADNGNALKAVLSEYELQAIGNDGMAADDISEGGGHYREVVKVGSFLEGYRKAEERKVARETATMLLQRLVKEGVRGLDQLLAGMMREGDDMAVGAGAEAGQLNAALVKYLEEAIREQEKRTKKTVDIGKEGGTSHLKIVSNEEEDRFNAVWNVTRGEDGTIIETFDPNDPSVGKILREEIEQETNDGEVLAGESLLLMTVQEKILLLLKLLRDRVKVEAAIGNDGHAQNLRILAYCLKAGSDEERQKIILDEMGSSLDSLDTFSDLVMASIDYAEARSNDDDFMPGAQSRQTTSPVLNISKLQKIKVIVERIKGSQAWKASGVSL